MWQLLCLIGYKIKMCLIKDIFKMERINFKSCKQQWQKNNKDV